MINKLTIAVSVVVIFILGFFVYRKYFIESSIHYHAGFRVFVNGVLQDFSGPEYMSLKPCGGPVTKGEEQDEKAHLHDRVGYVVHVHRPNSKWADLFRNIHYELNPSKPTVAYINRKQVVDLLDRPIEPYQSLVLIIGKHGDVRTYLQQAVTEKEIKAVEARSEDCGT